MQTNENPWTTLSTRPIYENPWIKVDEHQVLNPAGNPGIYGSVHFKNFAIGIVPLDEDGYTWLVGQWRYMLKTWSWEIPEGGGPLDVDILVSAQRELLEETGIKADNWTELHKIHLSNSVSDEVGYIFLAQSLSFGLAEREDTEADMRMKRLKLTEAVAWVGQGLITDSMSIIGLLSAERYLAHASTKG